jgi:hypothetical protein
MTIGSLAALYLAIAAIGLIHAGLMTAQAYEFRRYALSRLRHPTPAPIGGRAAIIVTCRGLDLGLTENLRSLFEQDYDDYVLILVVDHRDDPAYDLIERLCQSYPDRSWRLIVAGAARNCGQKVHNLLAATAALPKEIEYLAFADSDTRTSRSWLRQLMQHLDMPGVAAATAYRWLVPARPTLPNLLLHSLDAGVATVIGPARHHFVWGGSWAIRRETFERFRLAAAWRGTLSDDLVAARALYYAGRVRFEPEALAPTTIDYDWPDLFSFVHRQFALGRRYAPGFWAVGTLAAVIHQGVFWTGIVLLPSSLVLGGWGLWAVAASAALYAMQVARSFLRQDAVRQLLPDYQRRLTRARSFDLWLAPLAGLLGCWGLISALVSPRIRWRGIHYRVFADGRIAVLESTIAPVAQGAGEGQASHEPSIDGRTTEGAPLPVGNHTFDTPPFAAHPSDTHSFGSAPGGGQTSAKLPPGTRLGRAQR